MAASTSVDARRLADARGHRVDFAGITPTGPTHRSGHPLPFLGEIQQSFGRYDVSRARAITGNAAAVEGRRMGAEAFTRGLDVSFASTPSLHTAAHEAAHVIQQLSGAALTGGQAPHADAYERQAEAVAGRVVRGHSSEDLLGADPAGTRGSGSGVDSSRPRPRATIGSVVQMRRIPPNVRVLLTGSAGGNGPNFAANAEGVQRLIDAALGELSPAQQARVRIRRLGGLTEVQFSALPPREQRVRGAEAIVAEFSGLQFGDPNLIDTGPRALTSDAANLTKVVGSADKIFNDIATGARDAWLTQVFGAGSVTAAKAKYAKGRTAMNSLHGLGRIVTDRSGYSEEVSLGGLTDPPGTPSQKIRVAKSVIDSPAANDSITTLLHESMHAGNADVSDDIYSTATGFTTQTAAQKLNNSAHYEVVPWRILEPTNPAAFAVVPATTPPTFQTFIPAGTTVAGVTAPARTDPEKGAVAAYDLMREAWTIGLNLHPLYVQLFRTSTDWRVPQPAFGGRRFDGAIPFWSKVEKLTIHKKTVIDPASPDEAKHPVSQIDVALSEGVIRKLAFGMDVLDALHTDAQIRAFENANSSASERSTAFPGGAHNNVNTERDFLLRLAVRSPKVAPITGPTSRDLRVVRELGGLNWGDVLLPRNPASFAD